MSGAIRTSLDPDRLIEAAEAETGERGVGDAEFVECLAAFCASVRDEARLPDWGIAATEQYVVSKLSNRLRFHRDLREHPEILDEELVPPIVIVGLPRTGTTKLLRVLSQDPAMQRLDLWRSLNPAPLPGSGSGEDPRIQIALGYQKVLDTFPDYQAAHPMDALSPDEDLVLYELTFDAYVYPFRYRMPSFCERVRSRPARPAYDYVKTVLQYLQWQDGGGRGRPWVLKTPVHMGHLPVLLETYPGATVVHCHRDPRVVMPSFVRLIEVLHELCTDDVDIETIRDESMSYWSAAVSQNLRDREDGCEANVIDVMFDDICDDVGAVVAEVYRKAGHTLSPQVMERFTAWEEQSSHEAGVHKYSLEHAGLTDAAVEEAFAEYITRFFPRTRGA